MLLGNIPVEYGIPTGNNNGRYYFIPYEDCNILPLSHPTYILD